MTDQSLPGPADRDPDTRPIQPTPAGPTGPTGPSGPSGPSGPPSQPPPGYDAPAWGGPRPAANPFAQPTPPATPTATAYADARPAAPVTSSMRGRRRFAAGVIAASLLLGGGAGIGGAAAWDAWSGDDAGSIGAGAANPVRSTSEAAQSSTSEAGDGTVESVAEKVLPSVVKIEVTSAAGSGSGSGIILSSDGQILTNNHVVESAADGSGAITVAFDDGTSATAQVLGTDPLTDTALIQADDVTGLTPAAIGTSGDLQVGQSVVAVGSPFGLESTVTSGIVSALNRPVDVGSDGDGNSTTYPAIQTDAAINPGNSGGPLTDMAGNVVGINSSIRTAGTSTGEASGSIGLGFAIPMDEIIPIVEQMANGQTPTHARLGVSVGDVSPQGGASTQPGLPGLPGQPTDPTEPTQPTQPTQPSSATEGALISEVNPGSTAEGAGIVAGDVITRVDDQIITGADSLVATIRSYRPGDTVTLTYVRGEETLTAELTLDSDADATP